MILGEREDLWQPRQTGAPSKKRVRVRFYLLLPYLLIGIAMCYFLVRGLFAIVDWLSRMWDLEIIPTMHRGGSSQRLLWSFTHCYTSHTRKKWKVKAD